MQLALGLGEDSLQPLFTRVPGETVRKGLVSLGLKPQKAVKWVREALFRCSGDAK